MSMTVAWQLAHLAISVIVTMGGSVVASETTDNQASVPEIGPTAIRFYSGNLSVSEFMAYWGTGGAGQFSGASKQQNELLKRCSVTAMCDYPAWCLIESVEGQWDWSLYEANQRILAEDSIQYNVFPWLHFPPKWFDNDPRFTRYTNLEDGQTIPQLSLWSPFTLDLYDQFYRRLAKQFEDRIAFLRLAMPSEYGEIGYCSGMTKWLRPQPNAKPGYWCGDVHAQESFRKDAMRRYGTLRRVNEAWGTTFERSADIVPPDVSNSGSRAAGDARQKRRWLDFADWYNQSWDVFLSKAVGIVRRHYPGREIIISLGYGSEKLCYGNDQSRYIASMSRLGVAAQTPGDIGYFATRRVSSACRAYGVPYFTEPPGDVPRDRQISRIWMDASNGTQTWFDYPANLDRARDLFVRYKKYLDGAPPRCGVAVWMPTAHFWLHPDQDWPENTLHLANALRPFADYEVVDDRMIRDGALRRLGIRVLILAESDVVDARAMAGCLKWVEQGGVLVCLRPPGPGVYGELPSIWASLTASVQSIESLPEIPDAAVASEVWREHGRVLGKGRAVIMDTSACPVASRAALVASIDRAMADLGAFRPGSYVRAPGAPGAILSTFFADRVLMMNTSDASIKGRLEVYDARDCSAGAGWQPALAAEMTFAPREIKDIPLKRGKP